MLNAHWSTHVTYEQLPTVVSVGTTAWSTNHRHMSLCNWRHLLLMFADHMLPVNIVIYATRINLTALIFIGSTRLMLIVVMDN